MFNEASLKELRKAKERLHARAHSRAHDEERGKLPPGVGAVEASTAAYILGSCHRQSGGNDGGVGLAAGAALQMFALFADGSSFAPHAQAFATGLLAVCAYRSALGAERVAPSVPPAAARTVERVRTLQIEITIARMTATERG
jgi:hypothetical protein